MSVAADTTTWLKKEELEFELDTPLKRSQYKEVIERLHLLWSHPLAGPLRDGYLFRFQRRGARAEAPGAASPVTPAKSRFVRPGTVHTIGRRKASTAQLWLKENGSGKFTVNKQALYEYFPKDSDRLEAFAPLRLLDALGKFDVMCSTRGGGSTGQAGAIRLALSRALVEMDPAARPTLRGAGFLTRDSRAVERKKPGQKKARKKFQWYVGVSPPPRGAPH